jgi:hypothetical protein
LDGGGGLCFELVQVGLDTVLRERCLHFWRAGLQVRCILRQGGRQVGCLAHEWARDERQAAHDHDANHQIRDHDGDQSVPQATGEHAHRSAQCKRQDGGQGEQHQGVEEWAQDLPDHPQDGEASEQRQQYHQRLIPVAVEQPARRAGQGRVSRGIESTVHVRRVNSDSVRRGVEALIVECRHVWATLQSERCYTCVRAACRVRRSG